MRPRSVWTGADSGDEIPPEDGPAEDGTADESSEATTDLTDEPTEELAAVGEPDQDAHAASYAELAAAFDTVEAFLLGEAPSLTRTEVAARAGVPLELAEQLWRWLGFPHAADDDVAFAESDVEALQMTTDLMQMGILSPDSQAALVRTWGRSYARLAEWQTTLLAGIAIEGPDPDLRLAELAAGVLPRVEALQTYVWRRHLASAASRLVSSASSAQNPEVPLAVCFVDIVGYTTQSRNLPEHELVDMIERFEQEATDTVVEGGGRVIKTIGDEILYAADDVTAAAEIALRLTARGADEDDTFPAVRAGLAHGDVVARLGDVFGATVNVASRLTSVARPGTVVIDRGAYDALTGAAEERAEAVAETGSEAAPGRDTAVEETGVEQPHAADDAAEQPDPGDSSGDDEPDDLPEPYRFKRLRRVSVKGYSRLEAWRLKPSKEREARKRAAEEADRATEDSDDEAGHDAGDEEE